MAYLLSNDTANWLAQQRGRGNLASKDLRGWIINRDDRNPSDVWVCRITGGSPLTGYTAKAYRTMSELRADADGAHGRATTIFPVEIGLDATLPQDTIVLTHEVLCRVTGGSEEA